MTENKKQIEFTPEENLIRVQNVFKGTYSDVLGLEILEVRSGFCRAVIPVKKEFLNPMGALNGGFLYTIADAAGGVAATHLTVGESVTTISGTMQFFRAALNLSHLYVEARIVKDGKRIAFVETDLLSEDGTLYAKGSFSFARLDYNKEEPLPQK